MMKFPAVLSCFLAICFTTTATSCHNPTFPLTTATKALTGSGRNQLGINLNWAPTDDYSQDRVFADAMKSARSWFKGRELNSPVPANVDPNFWPTEDACLTVMAGLDRNEGTYQGQFTGQAKVSAASYGLAGTVTSGVYNPATNTTSFTVVITQSSGIFSLAFANTKRLPTDTLATGITNLQIMRPLTEGSTQSYPFVTPPTSNLDPTYTFQFTDQLKALVSKFKVIRFMDFFRTNCNQLVNWADRPQMMDASYGSAYRPLPDINGDGHTQPSGGSYEAAIDLCNQTNCDLWLNVPLHASDDYVTQLATLVQTRLKSTLNVYVEYSNEVWNTGGGFTQGGENRDLAIAEENATILPSLKNTPSDTNDWMWAWRRVGRRIVEISNIFRTVWTGADDMPSPTNPSPRVRPVLMFQQGYEAGPGENPLMFIDRNYPQPLNYYLYGCGGSGYYNPNDDAGINLETIWSSGTMSPSYWYNNPCKIESVLAHAYGLKRICYEGGPSLDKGSKNDAVRAMAWGDPRMQQNLVDHVDQAWSAADSDLFVFYASAGDYPWGFVQNLFNLATPKLQAIDQLNSQWRAAPTLGQVPPCTINGADYDGYEVWNGGWGYRLGTDMNEGFGDNLMYAFRTVTPGTCTLAVKADVSTDTYQILCDGIPVSVVAPGTKTVSPVPMANLKPGVHVIVFRTQSAPLTVHSLTITGP